MVANFGIIAVYDFTSKYTIHKYSYVNDRGEREKILAKTEIEDLQNQLEQMTKSKVNCNKLKINIVSSSG